MKTTNLTTDHISGSTLAACFTLKLNNLVSKKLPVWIKRWQTDLCSWCCISACIHQTARFSPDTFYRLSLSKHQKSCLSPLQSVQPRPFWEDVWPSESAPEKINQQQRDNLLLSARMATRNHHLLQMWLKCDLMKFAVHSSDEKSCYIYSNTYSWCKKQIPECTAFSPLDSNIFSVWHGRKPRPAVHQISTRGSLQQVRPHAVNVKPSVH